MANSHTRSLYYDGWWDSQTQQPGHGERSHAGDGVILLPLPSFPPPIDFDPSTFTLAPSYGKVVDLEKAVYPIRSHNRRFSDVSTLCQRRISHDYSQSKYKSIQTLLGTPPRRHVRMYRCFRYTILTAYQRLFTFIFTLNFTGVLILLWKHRLSLHGRAENLNMLSTFASSNFLLSILIRQDYLISLLFRAAWLVPWSTPVWFRRIVARMYCYGGIHSGAAIAGTIWWIVFAITMTLEFVKEGNTFTIITVAWILLLLLLAILLLAHPTMRTRYHNTFEITHRFFGWSAVIMFWSQLLLLARHTSKTLSPHRNLTTTLLCDPVSPIQSTHLHYPAKSPIPTDPLQSHPHHHPPYLPLAPPPPPRLHRQHPLIPRNPPHTPPLPAPLLLPLHLHVPVNRMAPLRHVPLFRPLNQHGHILRR